MFSNLDFYRLFWKMKKKTQTSKQTNKQINKTVESFPQFILQIYFLFSLSIGATETTDTITSNAIVNESNAIIIASIIFSFLSIVSKKLSQDKDLVTPEWQNFDFEFRNCLFCCFKPGDTNVTQRRLNVCILSFLLFSCVFIFYGCALKKATANRETQTILFANTSKNIQTFANMSKIKTKVELANEDIAQPKRRAFNYNYLNRYLWRIVNVSSRLCLLFAIWRVIGGGWLIGVIFFEFLYYYIIYYYTKQFIFLESIMGYVAQNVHIDGRYENYWRKKETSNHSYFSIFKYQMFTIALLSFGLCVLFGISPVIDCCEGIDLETFLIAWFVILFVCCCIPCFGALRAQSNNNIKVGFPVLTLLVLFRCVMFCLMCIIFNFYVFLGLLFLDGLNLLRLAAKRTNNYNSFDNNKCKSWFSKESFNYFVVHFTFSISNMMGTFLEQDIYIGMYREYLLYSFQHLYSLIYFLLLLFFCVYEANVRFVIDYKDIQTVITANDNAILYVLIYVGISVTILPIWTYYLIFHRKMINEEATNDRDLDSLSNSGDIYGLIEMSQFGNVVNLNEMKKYLETAFKTSNFQDNIFPTLYVLFFVYFANIYNVKNVLVYFRSFFFVLCFFLFCKYYIKY